MPEQLKLSLEDEGSRDSVPYDLSKSPLERLDDPKYHDKILSYALKRLNISERKMKDLYPRWRVNELKTQAYVDLPDYEKVLEQMNKDKKPPSPVSITFPYAFANAWTVVTYHLHTFCGRSPMFQVQATKAESVAAAQNMEKLLQWNADATRLTKSLFNFFMDGQIYGVGVLRTLWKVRKSKRSIWVPPTGIAKLYAMASGKPGNVRQQIEKITFEGNEVEGVDPFMFFPDPSVPMADVNRKGEFVFWRTFPGKHALFAAQANGEIKYMEKVKGGTNNRYDGSGSVRSDWLGGESHPGNAQNTNNYQFDQGTLWILPREMGFGPENKPELWLIGIVNKSQIVQLEPLDYEHEMHPISVIEPNTFGYGFGQAGLIDYIGPIQDTLSWLLNSHIHNVRSVLNNSFIYDPSMIEQQDLKNGEPGKLIRLKRSAIGQDVRTAIMQLNVQDVTQGHMNDVQSFQRVADIISGVGDNIRGLQDAGGRKTATEVRTSNEAGASRLAAQSRLISAQGITDLAEQMASNLQSKLTQEIYMNVLGAAGMDNPVSIGAESIAGDFIFPTHDGTLPLDRVALFDVWQQVLQGAAADQELRQSYSYPKLFEFVAKLGGAENIESFKINVAPPGQEGPGPGQVPVGSLG